MSGIDDKIDASEARTDAKFEKLRADLARDFGELRADLAGKPSTGTLVATSIAIVATLLAVLAFAGSRFDSGMSTRGAIESALEQQNAAQAERDQAIVNAMNQLADDQHKRAQHDK